MKTISYWMDTYAESHQNPTNKKIHYICVPLIMLTLLGLLWETTKPALFDGSVWFNWAMLLTAIAFIFYLYLSLRLFVAMIIVYAPFVTVNYWLHIQQPFNLYLFYGLIFVLAWIGQFIGHKIEGKKPSFLTDLLFLFIGPIWVFIRIKGIQKLIGY